MTNDPFDLNSLRANSIPAPRILEDRGDVVDLVTSRTESVLGDLRDQIWAAQNGAEQLREEMRYLPYSDTTLAYGCHLAGLLEACLDTAELLWNETHTQIDLYKAEVAENPPSATA